MHALRRELMLAVDPERFPDVIGSTDTEVLFHLALTMGLEHDPLDALARTIAVVEDTARRSGLEPHVQGTFGISDGESLWAARHCTDGPARSLFVSADVATIRRLHANDQRLARLGADDRLVVSEPFSDLPGVWQEVPQASSVTVRRGGVLEHHAFTPHAAPLVGG